MLVPRAISVPSLFVRQSLRHRAVTTISAVTTAPMMTGRLFRPIAPTSPRLSRMPSRTMPSLRTRSRPKRMPGRNVCGSVIVLRTSMPSRIAIMMALIGLLGRPIKSMPISLERNCAPSAMISARINPGSTAIDRVPCSLSLGTSKGREDIDPHALHFKFLRRGVFYQEPIYRVVDRMLKEFVACLAAKRLEVSD